MKSEGLTSSRLAEMLEVQPSGISHILSGRNKPGFDFLQKILRRFPQINPDWLLLDSGAMYRAMQGEMSANQAAEVAGAAGSPAADGHDTGLPEVCVLPGFDVDAGVGRVLGGSGISPASVADRAASGVSNAASRAVAGASSPSGAASSGVRPVDAPAVPCGESGGVTVDCATDGVVRNGFAIPRIERIVVFYSDGTFCDYSPKK